MSYKDWRVRVDDMMESIRRCLDYVAGMDEAAFIADPKTVDAVARNLEIIGEAANKMPTPVEEAHPRVPWRRLADIRHVLIHEYHSVDADILYRTVINDLPPLLVQLQAVLDDVSLPEGME
ncbi:DUF86 domain-containing protein [Novispirillum sp. DQ9]|uniref:HepT-like ribonuclease domain-containing protein n=1 Tax=Novispirillum sp. DQ9 TaxID=3398612 RepID=UPI003C7E1119